MKIFGSTAQFRYSIREVPVLDAKELEEYTREFDTFSLLRFLIVEKFPGKTLASCSLRARSVVLLKMISTPIPKAWSIGQGSSAS
jgi:hypothetical protein